MVKTCDASTQTDPVAKRHYSLALKLGVVSDVKNGMTPADASIKYRLPSRQTVYDILHWYKESGGQHHLSVDRLVKYLDGSITKRKVAYSSSLNTSSVATDNLRMLDGFSFPTTSTSLSRVARQRRGLHLDPEKASLLKHIIEKDVNGFSIRKRN